MLLLLAISLTLILSAYTSFYIARFTAEIIRNMDKTSYGTGIFFLGINFSVLLLLITVVKQMFGGL